MGKHAGVTPLDAQQRARVNGAVKRAIEGAAESLALHGWCQGRGYEDGKRCVTNAIGTSAMEVDEMQWMELSVAATKAVLDDLKLGMGTLAQWNDAPDRTADDVIETLKRVASRL